VEVLLALFFFEVYAFHLASWGVISASKVQRETHFNPDEKIDRLQEGGTCNHMNKLGLVSCSTKKDFFFDTGIKIVL